MASQRMSRGAIGTWCVWAAVGGFGVLDGAAFAEGGRGLTGMKAYQRHAGLGEHACRHCRLNALSGSAVDPSAPERKFDPVTGEDRRNYPHDRFADIHHAHLDLHIERMDNPVLRGTQNLRLTATGEPLALLRLDARDLSIGEVSGLMLAKISLPDPPRVASFDHDGETLSIRFDPPLPPDLLYELTIDYQAVDPVDGLFWTLESEAWPGRPAQIHTQGQPETSSYWFPTHDFPNERHTASFEVTAPNGYQVSTNGSLVWSRPSVESGTHTTWRYELDREHPPYLTTLVVGQFAEVDVAPAGSTVRMPVWAPEAWRRDIEPTYRNTSPMLDVFEERFDEPYPWDDRYAQLVVWNFGAGGMENTTATTMFDTAVLDPVALRESDLDGLIAHELAHQWFGDQLTCHSWEHIWLNEGWATYSEALWFEKRDGYQDGYLHDLLGAMRTLPKRDYLAPGSSDFRPGMASKVYKHPWEVFRRASNPYPKGAATLHMLRVMLGDSVFFQGVGEYVDRYKWRTVETDQFRRVLEEVSGRSLERFFDQWVYRPGTPRLEVRSRFDTATGELTIGVDQLQRIDEMHPAFAFDLPIHIYEGADAEPQRIVVPVSGRSHERAFAFDREPYMVVVDPELTVLADVHPKTGARMLVHQLLEGPSMPARVEAATALRHHSARRVDGVPIRDYLGRVVAGQRGQDHHAVRSAAAESLGSLAEFALLDRLFRELAERDDEPRVLAAIATALHDCPPDEESMLALASFALDGVASYAARANMMESLGRHATPATRDRAVALYERALATESQHDTVRRGALAGLSLLDLSEGLDLAIPFTRKGHLSRLRPSAIATVADLSHHDPHRAYHAIAPLLYEREEARTVTAAIDALGRIEHEDGLTALATFASATRHPVHAERARVARDGLAALLSSGDAVSLETTIERLERQVEQLRNQIDAPSQK